MKALSKLRKKLTSDNRGVFGMDAVLKFFSIILSVALLGYIIIVIMGTLSGTNILTAGSDAANQSTFVLNNVSAGIVTFFSTLTSAWTVLAVMVILLVLIVLIQVIRGREGGGAL